MNCVNFPELPIGQNESDWSYSMRREMQEIIPGVYLGPYAAAMKSRVDDLKRHSVTHIICIRQNIEAHFIRPNFPQIFSYLVLDVADSITENIIQIIPQVRCFIDECLKCNGKVLVHGNAGISRSAALVMAYIIEKYGLSFRDAYNYVQQKRFCINPNEGFANQLMEFEAMCKARFALEKGTTSSGELKRKCSFDEEELQNSISLIT